MKVMKEKETVYLIK